MTAGESSRARGGMIPNTADGIGDLQVKGKYYWLPETDVRPAVDLTGRVKIPTASAEKGLGTGRVDVGFGPSFWKRIGALRTFADLELVLRDRPSGSTIKSTRLDYAVGVGYPFTPRVTAYASLEGATQGSAGVEAPLELVLSAVYKVKEAVSLSGFVLTGLTTGSPDVGAGAGVTVRC